MIKKNVAQKSSEKKNVAHKAWGEDAKSFITQRTKLHLNLKKTLSRSIMFDFDQRPKCHFCGLNV